MATQRTSKIGTLPWEDEAPAETRFRRPQQVAPSGGPVTHPGARVLPGMPLELAEDDEEELPRRRRRFDTPSGPWYRPTTKFGRVVLSLAALVLLGGLISSFILLRNFLERDPHFRIAGVQDIQAAGLNQVSRQDILPAFGADIGRNIFFIHLNDRRKQLEQIPWIEHATVMRLLPNQIRVVIKGRTPIAFVRLGSDIELADASGVVLSMSPEAMTTHHYSFPVVTGIDPRDPLPSRRARMAVYQRLIGELDSTGRHFSNQISEIDLTDPEDARVLMPEQGADILAHFGDDRFLERYQRYQAHIAEWRQQYPHLSAVDLRYDNQVVLEMAPSSGGAPAAVSSTDGKPVANPAPAAPDSSAEAAKPSPAVAQAPAATHPHPASQAAQHKTHAGSAAQDRAREQKKLAAARHAAWLRSLKNKHANAGSSQ
ncbi:MAG: FtsQ-type POTRA domain-containing protein [Terracidiphilus sp.]